MKTIRNRLSKTLLGASFVGASLLSGGTFASDEGKLEEALERIDELEEALWSLEEKVGDRAVANAFDGIRLDIGGFFHTAYTSIDADDGSAQSFNRQNFELLIGAELAESWSAFFAGGFLRESDPALSIDTNRTDPVFNNRNKNPQIIGWVNYAHSNLFNVRIGRMITPHGVINIEHFPATLLDPEQPQFLRPFSGDTIFPNFATGIQFHGKYYTENVGFRYATYYTNTSSAPNESQLGGRVAAGFMDDAITVGLNFADGTRNDRSDYDLFGIDLLANIGQFQLKSEYYSTDESDTPGVDTDREAFYIQPAWNFTSQWTGFIRYDELDLGEARGESTEYAYGVNYVPHSQVRLRVIYTEREYEDGALPDADADIFQISGTFSF